MIRLQNVHKRYSIFGSEVHALRGVDLAIDRGDFVFLVGVSGSGKSTFLHLAGALDRPTEGQILFDGRDLEELTPRERAHLRRDRVGFVFQAGNLLPNLTALDNVLIPLLPSGLTPDRRARARALLERVGLAERIEHRPHQLSGGEAQRVAFARAFVSRPEVVLADEPTGELDSTTSRQLMDHLEGLHREEGATVVVVTHDLSLPGPGHRVLSLRDGLIVSDERLGENGQDQSRAIASAQTSSGRCSQT
jgi:ABC-type lipoprotein export system ATPase subunit